MIFGCVVVVGFVCGVYVDVEFVEYVCGGCIGVW